MSLSSPDGNGLGRYAESTPIGSTFSAFLNLALVAVSKLFGRPQQFANLAAQSAHTGMIVGDKARRADTTVTMRYSGSAWKEWESDWISFTPTLTNFTIGTGGVAANTAEYKWVEGDLRIRGRAFLGTSGSSVGSGVVIGLPVSLAAVPFTNIFYNSTGTLFDTSAPATSMAFIRANGTLTNSVNILALVAGAPASVTTTVPWTWAAGDGIYYDFTARAA